MAALRSRHAAGSELSIALAGCSIGVEADTVLAIHKLTEFGGRLSLRGIDRNKEAIAIARAGKYRTEDHSNDKADFSRPVNDLADGGFVAKFILDEASDNKGHFEVDAQPGREGHHVEFATGDIVDFPQDSAQLVMVNNVLFHLDPVVALQKLSGLARVGTNDAILSIGGVHPLAHIGTRYGAKMEYDDWLSKAATMLNKDHGYTPLVDTGNVPFVSQPTMFARE